jgi:hypothetical protein
MHGIGVNLEDSGDQENKECDNKEQVTDTICGQQESAEIVTTKQNVAAGSPSKTLPADYSSESNGSQDNENSFTRNESCASSHMTNPMIAASTATLLLAKGAKPETLILAVMSMISHNDADSNTQQDIENEVTTTTCDKDDRGLWRIWGE